jgi:type I restriction enzyme S subunit
MQPLKHLADVRFSSVDKKSVDGQVPVRLCNYTDVYYNDRIVADMPFMEATATPDQVVRFSLRAGDVLLTKDSETVDDIGVSALVAQDLPDVLCGYHLAIARPRSDVVDGRFLRWALAASSARGQLEVAATGVTRFGLRQDAVAGMLVPTPSLAAQRAIADYLDAESARIDALLAARRRQVDLIGERVKTAIWHGATKGVRRTERAPSGLDWVGDMPRHWGLPSVGANFDIQLGKMLNPEAAQAGEQLPYLRNVNVQWDRIDLGDLNEMHFDVQDRMRYALEPGDLIVCEGGEVGRAALWGAITGCYYQKALHRVRPRRDASARFLMYALWAAASRGVFESEGNTSTIVHLTAEKLRAHRFPWPPRAEQDEIVEALDRLRSESELMKTALGSQVDLLIERRQALITAAVTGQLEIPGVAA